MNHYLYLTVKEKCTGFAGMVISVDEIMELLRIQFPYGAKWSKEDEIEVIGGGSKLWQTRKWQKEV